MTKEQVAGLILELALNGIEARRHPKNLHIHVYRDDAAARVDAYRRARDILLQRKLKFVTRTRETYFDRILLRIA